MKLQRHEKFALRDGWINKGLLILSDDKGDFYDSYYESRQDRHFAFIRKNAPDVFGMGNNMVKSLRFWMRACGLLDERGGNAGTYLSKIGEVIAEYDLYLENPYTLWVLHSMLVKNFKEATSWNVFFNKCNVNEVTRSQIFEIMMREMLKISEGKEIPEKSLKSDIDVLLNLYLKKSSDVDPEENNHSPFSELEMIKETGNGLFSKNYSNKKGLNEWNIYLELVERFQNTKTIAIEDLADGNNGIRRIYQIPMMTLNDYLDRLDALELIKVNRTAGLDVIYKINEDTPITAMKKYYERCQD